MNLGGPENLEEEGLGGEGVGSDDVGEESAGGEDVGEESASGGYIVEEGDIEDQCGAISAHTPSCFDCGRVFSSWQDVNIHARTCS